SLSLSLSLYLSLSLCLSLSLSLCVVTGYSGGEVNIRCKYVKNYTQNTKYFCKGKMPEKEKGKWCTELIRTEEKDKWAHSGRFSLFDDTRAAVFNVTIRDLSEGDSGTYQCGVDRTTAKDSYTEVKMNVRKEITTHNDGNNTKHLQTLLEITKEVLLLVCNIPFVPCFISVFPWFP
uniref:Immunoglobulin V-set domain-containing protein n=1 Tax=Sinocyclocheilus grahami TaxID=75366 RepID=A0A672LN65_SINGR